MAGKPRLSGVILTLAAAGAASASVLAIQADALPAGAVAAVAAVLAVAGFVAGRKRGPGSAKPVVAKAAELADTARKLAIFDQETGVCSRWYVALRCEEECYRSVRYKLPFTLLVVEPAPASDNWETRGQLADWLVQQRRRSDIAGHLGDGRFVLLMPETDSKGAQIATARILDAVPGTQTGLSCHLEDGGNFEQLLEAAAHRVGDASQLAA